MNSWFISRNGALVLSALALISELWRAFLDFHWEYSRALGTTGLALLGTLIYTAIFVGWGWAWLRAREGLRRGLIAALVLTLLLTLAIPVGTLVAYCPSSCRSLWPLMELSNWFSLLLGLLATVALAWQIWRPAGRGRIA